MEDIMKKKVFTIILLMLAVLIAILLSFRIYHAETTIMKATLSDNSGHTVAYYVCGTSYMGFPPPVSGLHFSVLSQVFDLESAQLQEELIIHGYPAAIYRIDKTLYFCITVSPESSGVLEYTDDAISAESALRIMNSIFEYPEDIVPTDTVH